MSTATSARSRSKRKELCASRVAIRTSREQLELFANSLSPDDQVALEASSPALAVARILEPHVAGVVVANPRKLRVIAESKVKTDQVDASCG
jgi:transposase